MHPPLPVIWHRCKAMKMRWTVGDQAGVGGGNRARVRTTCLRGPVVENRREIGFSQKQGVGLQDLLHSAWGFSGVDLGLEFKS